MKKLFSIVGSTLILASIITPVVMIILQLRTFPYDIFKEGIFPGLIAFIVCFFPGKYLLDIGMNKRKETKQNKSSLIIILITILGILVSVTYAYISRELQLTGYQDVFWIPFMVTIFLAPFLYGLSLILLIIDYFKQKIN